MRAMGGLVGFYVITVMVLFCEIGTNPYIGQRRRHLYEIAFLHYWKVCKSWYQISAFTLPKCIVTKKFLSASLLKKTTFYKKNFKDRLGPRPHFVKVAINANILGGNGLFNHKNIMQICLMLTLPVEYFVVVLIFA